MAEVIPAPAPVERTAQYVVTSENRAEFMDKRLDITKPAVKEVAPEKPVAIEIPKFGEKTVEPVKEGETPAPKKGHPIQERFSEMAEQRREAEAKLTAEHERAEKAERELQELRTKTTPAPKEEEQLGAKPSRAQFAEEAEFTEKLVEWSIKKDRMEQAAATEQARIAAEATRVLTTWQQRLDKARAEIPDFEEKMKAAESVVFSQQVRDAILESPEGPRILYYYAEHQDEAEKLKGLSALSAVRAIGRLEADLTPKEKEVKSTPKAPEAQISKAPAPISPLKGSSAPEDLVDSAGKFKGDFKQYKQLRKEGKLK